MKNSNSLFGDGDFVTQSVLNFTRNNLDLYAVGYKEAADILTDSISVGNKQDLLVYPAVFLYRHYLELRLKEIIIQGNELLDTEDKKPYGHDLFKLWEKSKVVMKKIWEDSEEPSDFLDVEKIVIEYTSIDPDSQSFRYPESVDGKNKLQELKYVDVPMLKSRIQKVSNFLDGVSSGIAYYIDARMQDMSCGENP